MSKLKACQSGSVKTRCCKSRGSVWLTFAPVTSFRVPLRLRPSLIYHFHLPSVPGARLLGTVLLSNGQVCLGRGGAGHAANWRWMCFMWREDRMIPGLKLNEHGFYVDQYPARFRTIDECNRYMRGELPEHEMLKPGSKEYDD